MIPGLLINLIALFFLFYLTASMPPLHIHPTKVSSIRVPSGNAHDFYIRRLHNHKYSVLRTYKYINRYTTRVPCTSTLYIAVYITPT